MSKPRGGPGNSAWMTCLACGSRWERMTQPYLPSLAQSWELPQTGVRRIENPQLKTPEAILQEKKALSIEALIKNQNTDEVKQLKAMFLNYQASGMLTPVECVKQIIRGCSTESEMVAVNAFVRIHVGSFE